MEPVTVEILHTSGCGSWEAARECVESAARAEGVPISFEARLIGTSVEAHEARFPGSPTIRVAGLDLQPDVQARGDFGLG
jgi:hypothetical protein